MYICIYRCEAQAKVELTTSHTAGSAQQARIFLSNFHVTFQRSIPAARADNEEAHLKSKIEYQLARLFECRLAARFSKHLSFSIQTCQPAKGVLLVLLSFSMCFNSLSLLVLVSTCLPRLLHVCVLRHDSCVCT